MSISCTALRIPKRSRASIISISCTALRNQNAAGPASRASAAQLFGTKTQPGQHHQHQLHSSSEPKRSRASIMSISCTALRNQNAAGPASSASAAQLFGTKTQPGQHHQHQLHSSSEPKCSWAGIMSISCTALRNQNAAGPAS